ncbi:MAG: SPOR domain-containing protein [Candidatus Omnitrophica bacterium]|nr:SPOR domain-containing protein [Candidatus Omnitrophota bacterium]
MAGVKGSEVWLIVLLVVVAAVFGVMSFSKDNQHQAKAPVADVLADKPSANQVDKPADKMAGKPVVADSIKAAHTPEDQAAVAAVKPTPAVVLAPQVLAPKESYAIQVYSFKDKTRADTALEKLKAKGHKAYVMVSDLGARGIWYRVRVGSFTNEDEAKKELETVTNEFKSGIIVTE